MPRAPTHQLASLIMARPWASVLVLAIVLALAVTAGRRLELQTGLDPFFDKASTLRQTLDQIEERFINTDVLYIAYQTADPFSHESLRNLSRLGEQLERVRVPCSAGDNSEGRGDPNHTGGASAAQCAAIDTVTSLATVKDLRGSATSFRTQALIPNPVPRDPELLREAAQRARNNPLIRNGLLGNDPTVASVVVRLRRELDDRQESAAVAATRSLLRQWQQRAPETRYYLTGEPVVDADVAHYQAKDLERFVPLLFVLIIALLVLFVRKVLGVAAALAAVVLSLGGALAVLQLIGSSLNNCSTMLPPVMIALTTAMMLHFLSELRKNASRAGGGASAARATLGGLLAPGAMAATTTAMGFGALATSAIPAVREFGTAAALGIVLAFIVTIAVFALAARWPGSVRRLAGADVGTSRLMHRALDRVGRLVTARPWVVLGASVILSGMIGIGVLRLTVDMRPVDFFGPETPIRQANDFATRHLSGTRMFVAAIRGPKVDQFADPAVLRRIERLQHFLENDLGLMRVTSVVDFVKLGHRELFEGQPRYWRLPETPQQVAQLLLLNGDTTLNEYIDGQRQWVRVVGRSDDPSDLEVSRKYAQLDRYLQEHFPATSGYATHAASRSRLWADMTTQLIESQIVSISLALLLIFSLIAAMLRSLRASAMAMLPNLLPVAMILGLMGWLAIPLDAATVMISAIALGIAVDDTIHFLQCYRARLREHGQPQVAIRETLQTKGPAIVWTSAVIGIGFAVLMLGDFVATQRFGLLLCIAMATALVGDLLVLPALILCSANGLRSDLSRGPRSRLSPTSTAALVRQPPAWPPLPAHHRRSSRGP